MKATLCERLRAPKAWMAWNDYGAVTIAGDPIPAMDHDSQAPREAADALTEAIAIARELARLACCMDAIPRGSIGAQVALLEDLERRVGVRA